VIHGTLLVTDHVHSRPAVTVRRPVPPEAPTDDIEFATVIAHLSRDGPVTVVDDVPHAVARKARAKVKPENASFIRV
jgi:hypothetical protein